VVEVDAFRSGIGTCAQVIATLYVAIAVEFRSAQIGRFGHGIGFFLLYGSAVVLAMDAVILFSDRIFFPFFVWKVLNATAIAYLASYFFVIITARRTAKKNGVD
jgi:hypothetical protein